ncbi:MAG: ABC transporter ATP-binding protein [Geminicoccaceae bacterium]|nr:ABC transporter ATP-binding protein [Geminicoccaceae bacterium]MCX7629430.1 ABC transporter ATP-binding protein [Geminicoccaceae bacterium]MDW8124260.1 ABC transporter ATP-binding protein [Geminicoccaceae bacterium]MDW8341131.1 ABC transporter ATP-binding protein [Geminicoccaceae bacterium]
MLALTGFAAGWHRGVPAVQDVDLELAEGRVLAVLGRNGAGKTTLVKGVLGLAPWRSGIVRLDGRRIDGWRPERIARAGIGFVPQGRGVFPGLTVEENLRLGALGSGRRRPDPALLARFPHLFERRDRPAEALSGGEQRQLSILRALAGRPRFLLLDEPSEGVQPTIVEAVAALLLELVEVDRLGILLVEQDLDLVLRVAHECLVLEDGRPVDWFSAAELAARPQRVEHYLGL